MRSAIIERGAVVNVIMGQIEGSVSCGDDVGIGWNYAGKTFTAPDPEEPELEAQVPASITPLQARTALRSWGIGREQITAFFSQITDREAREIAEDAREYATQIERNNQLVTACAAFLGMSEDEIDEFLKDAAAS